jgi:hypothetical protein
MTLIEFDIIRSIRYYPHPTLPLKGEGGVGVIRVFCQQEEVIRYDF